MWCCTGDVAEYLLDYVWLDSGGAHQAGGFESQIVQPDRRQIMAT